MDQLFFVVLLVIHVVAAAVWVGGNTVIELVFQRKLNAINSLQGGLISKHAENAFTYMAWGALVTMVVTGIVMAMEQGMFNLAALTSSLAGYVLLVAMALTLAALVNASLLTWYFPPRLKLQRYSEDPTFRSVLLRSMQIQNRMAVAIVVLMAIYATLMEAPFL